MSLSVRLAGDLLASKTSIPRPHQPVLSAWLAVQVRPFATLEPGPSKQRLPVRRHRGVRRYATAATERLPSAPDSSSTSPVQARASAREAERQKAYEHLRPVVDSFSAPIDWAVAYGSGVMHQANRSPTDEPPLTDFLISTPSAYEFHRINMRQNPSHYPLYARLMGARAVAGVQETLGAEVWYVTMVKIGDLQVKYGVISTPSLRRDLEEWRTLYVSGRLHKPVMTLLSTSQVDEAQSTNLRHALHVALLQLPPTFTELMLWEQIAGISYSGDPRMSVPGAENPEKVKNIVRGKGVLEGFRELYQEPLADLPVAWSSGSDVASAWEGQGEESLSQPDNPKYYASLLCSLPEKLQLNIARHFRPTIVGALVSPEVRAARQSEPVKSRRKLPAAPEFWIKVVEEPRFREVVQNEMRHIIRRPALTQSIKGLFTAGLSKSFVYSLAKFRKWLKARRQRTAQGKGAI